MANPLIERDPQQVDHAIALGLFGRAGGGGLEVAIDVCLGDCVDCYAQDRGGLLEIQAAGFRLALAKQSSEGELPAARGARSRWQDRPKIPSRAPFHRGPVPRRRCRGSL
ncbi:hypothetical protein [Enhygromyxa salina]|uniref:hypothetical protein n=1 Tax=Enhygromyxa salina TaxID=215803 RepID=UPI0011BAD522|nr:hypothetical protein [Enhygromyxa salina]